MQLCLYEILVAFTLNELIQTEEILKTPNEEI